MPYIITRNWSRYHDQATNTHFEPVLDHTTGCFIGSAHVSDEKAKGFADRRGFDVLPEGDYLRVIAPPTPSAGAEPPAPSLTGDPLKDAAKTTRSGPGEPPAPPFGSEKP